MCTPRRGVNTKQLKTKNHKLRKLIEVSYRHKPNIFTISITNLSSSDIDVSNFKEKGMNCSFVDKNKFDKRNIAVEMEALAVSLDKSVDTRPKEKFHEFLRGHK